MPINHIMHIVRVIHTMHILSIINQKGGVAKTTTAHAIGTGLTRRGYKVLFVDLDPQHNLSVIMGAGIMGVTITDILTRQQSINNAIQYRTDGAVIASNASLASEGILTSTGKEYRLKEALESLEQAFDYVIIDCPPSLGALTINALTASTGCIVPAQADYFSLEALSQLEGTIAAVKKYTNPRLDILGVVITRYNNRAVLRRECVEMIRDKAQSMGSKLYSSLIRECISIAEAQPYKQNIFEYAPRSNGAKDYNALVDEIVEDTAH